MSFQINSDREKITGNKTSILGKNEVTLRSGSGSQEVEIIRAQIDPTTNLPRVGINRSGNRVESITVTNGGSGYSLLPTVTIGPPDDPTGDQAFASASIFNGQVSGILVNDSGSGYTTPPTVTITGGNGGGATAEAILDTIDYELDINGAIRTSTSIISDTARILNMDVDNFITPDLELRGPQFKTYMNNTGIELTSNPTTLAKGDYRYAGNNIYEALNNGTTSSSLPIHTDGIELNGTVNFKHIGFRIVDPNGYLYNETGDEGGVFPRSITPQLGDRSDKIATTEYVLNLATNDVGGRIYVSQQIGNDANDGRSAVAPVRTIKRACQLAWATPGVKESIIISGGDYVEDNPISIPPDASIVGDNLRLVIIRPENPDKHIFKFGDKNYVIGVTYRDYINQTTGRSAHTWDYAMVFDDKQRVTYDMTTNGDFGFSWPIGQQYFAVQKFETTFTGNTGIAIGTSYPAQLTAGQIVRGSVGASQGIIEAVTFDETDTNEPDFAVAGKAKFIVQAGNFTQTDRFRYGGLDPVTGDHIPLYANSTFYPLNSYVWTPEHTYQVTQAGTSPATGAPVHDQGVVTLGTVELTHIRTTYLFNSQQIRSTRPEGEVVFDDTDTTTKLSIVRLDFTQQGTFTGGFGGDDDVGGVVFYTNQLLGFTGIHDFKEGDEIFIEGMPTNSPDLSFLNGYQRIYKVIEDADGRSRRFVLPKKVSASLGLNGNDNFQPGSNAKVSYASHSVTFSLLNSPNKFEATPPVARRFQDACLQIRNNIDYIADEVLGKVNAEFAKFYYSVYDVTNVGLNTTFKIFLGGSTYSHTYISGGTVTVGGTAYNVDNFVWDNFTTGEATVTLDQIVSIAEDETVKIENLLLSCSLGQKVYPSFSIPVSDEKCRRDIGHFINAILQDLEFGSNIHTIRAAKRYITGAQVGFVDNEVIQTVRAFEYVRELMIFAMRKWRVGDGSLTQPLYAAEYTSLIPYVDPTIIDDTATPACANVASAIDTLAYLFVDVITNNTSGTYLDAAYLIAANRDLIADQAYLNTKTQYPSLGLSDVNERKCRRDINHVLSGLIRDLCLGGNAGIVNAAEFYFTGTSLTGIPEAQRDETIYAFQQTKNLVIQAIRNWTDGTVEAATPTTATYNPATGDVTVTIAAPANGIPTTSDRIAFAEGAITFSCQGGQHASPDRFDSNWGDSYPITNVSGSGPIQITCNVGNAGTASGDAHTFVSALTDKTYVIYDPVTTTSPIPQKEDWNILLYNTTPLCDNVASSITTAMDLLEDILDETVAAGSTSRTYGILYDTSSIEQKPEFYIEDAAGNIATIRSVVDDFPIIEASPYTQNSSIISFLGGSGALIDGSKVKQPNCPFAGLNADGTAEFPNQGKSMVASAFTIVSQGGTGYKVINDGYTQLVSVFVIFCEDGVLAESGGYASITNSATNFGVYALRASGYRDEAYEFDQGFGEGASYVRATVDTVTESVTGRTEFSITKLGRSPLEHYIVKLDGYRTYDPDIEYFIDYIDPVSVTEGPNFGAKVTLSDGSGAGSARFVDELTGQEIDHLALVNYHQATYGTTLKVRLHRPSIVNSSSHTWEFAGSGTTYNALPENGGTKIEAFEQVSQNYGRVYCSGTDELGDFKVGTFAQIENRTGNITFTGTVTISEVEFLKLRGGDVIVTGFDASESLGGANASNSKLPTQAAVRNFIINNLGPYLNKPYSTNPVPRALVELTDSGKINIDQIPALRPFNVYTVADQTERLALEGALAGDIAIQQDISGSFILNNDNDSLFLGFGVDPTIQFTLGDVFIGDVSGGRLQATEYRQGVVYQIVVTDAGSGYITPPTVNISGGSPQAGAVGAQATAQIAGGQVVSVTIITANGYKGGVGYTTAPTVTFSGGLGANGVSAQADANIESRLYGDIVNNIKMLETDAINSSDTVPVEVNVDRVINTSASDINNWVSLASTSFSADQIVSGIISTARLANNDTAANSFTFLRGDQSYAETVQSIKGAETRYFYALATNAAINATTLVFDDNGDMLVGHTLATGNGIQQGTSIDSVSTDDQTTTITIDQPLTAAIPAGTLLEFSRGSSPLIFDASLQRSEFIDQVIILNGGSGYASDLGGNNVFFDVGLDGGNGTGLKANIRVDNGVVTKVTVTSPGTGYDTDFTISQDPPEIGNGNNLQLVAKRSTVSKQFANVSIDVARAGGEGSTGSIDEYGTVGVVRLKKAQFIVGADGNGSVTLKTGAGSGLIAEFLGSAGRDGEFYQDSSNQIKGTLPKNRLSGEYKIDIEGTATSAKLITSDTSGDVTNSAPNLYSAGLTVENKFNNVTNLYQEWPEVGLQNATTGNSGKHALLTIRPGGIDLDTSYGGIKQLALPDTGNDERANIYLRGTGFGVSQFGDWNKVWTSGNDASSGRPEGPDAYRLKNKTAAWYRNAVHTNEGEFFDSRLPSFMSEKAFDTKIEIKEPLAQSGNSLLSGKKAYQILFDGVLLNDSQYGGIFDSGKQVNIYDVTGAQALGTMYITNRDPQQDTQDASNNFTIITAVLLTGGFAGSYQLGLASSNAVTKYAAWTDYALADSNTYAAASLEVDSGTANLRLGRRIAANTGTSPGIYFSSSQQFAPNYNSAIVASGGTAADGSGSLNIIVGSNNSFTVNNSPAWHEGNTVFTSANGATVYDALGNPSIRNAVMRDATGSFEAHDITLVADGNGIPGQVIGAASLNVLKAGDSMTGTLNILNSGGPTDPTSNLYVEGTLTVQREVAFARNLNVDGNVFTVDYTNDRVGIGTSQANAKRPLHVSYASTETDVAADVIGMAAGTSAGALIQNTNSDANTFAALDFRAESADGRIAYKKDISGSDQASFYFVAEAPAATANTVLIVKGTGQLIPKQDGYGELGTSTVRWDKLHADEVHATEYMAVNRGTTNTGAYLYLQGATGGSYSGGHLSNFRLTNQVIADDVFAINATDGSGAATYQATPALAIKGTTNRVAINTSAFSGVDTTDGANITRNYQLNVQGDVNFNGQLFQNNAEFVTSRWTEATNGTDIYRLSKVGINGADPQYELEVTGDINVTGKLRANGAAQWLDTYGVIKSNPNSLNESITVPANTNAFACGDLEIANGVTVTVGNSSTFVII